MRQPILTVIVMVLFLAIPCRAHQHHHHHHATASAQAKTAALKPAPVQITSSSKVPQVFVFQPPKAVAKTAAKPVPVAQVKPVAPATVKPAVDPGAVSSNGAPTITSPLPKGALARITAYWTNEDYYTSQHMSSTGARLEEGHSCAVDPHQIPYGSTINIPGMGNYQAVDTGSAVVSRQAAIGAARNKTERNALVVDLFFENRKEAEEFAAHGPTFVAVSWNKPLTAPDAPLNPRALPAGPQETARVQVYVLESAPSLADCRLPLNFRSPAVFQ